jgi:hypothetical protein
MSTVERRSKRNSRKRGSVTAFAAVLALTLMVLGIGFIIICLYMGGQRETKNATDAGALSVGKEAAARTQCNALSSRQSEMFLGLHK